MFKSRLAMQLNYFKLPGGAKVVGFGFFKKNKCLIADWKLLKLEHSWRSIPNTLKLSQKDLYKNFLKEVD